MCGITGIINLDKKQVEQKMLQKILEDAEIDHTHDSEKGEIFYSVFQKLVDI